MDRLSGGLTGCLCLASLSVLLLSGCQGNTPVKQVAVSGARPVVSRPAQTFVVRPAPVRTPATDRLQHQQQAQVYAVARQQPAARVTQAGGGQLSRDQYHARYQAELKKQQQAAQVRELNRQKAGRERVKKEAERQRYIARWQRDQQLASQKQQKQQQLAYQRQDSSIVHSSPAAATKQKRPLVVRPSPAPMLAANKSVANAPVVRKAVAQQQRGLQSQQRSVQQAQVADPRGAYLARWNQLQAAKRLEARKAEQRVESVIHTAKQEIGTKYKWGGTSRKTGFDCSGLVQHSIRAGANVEVPRTAAEQYQAAVKVAAGNAERGDLVFFVTRGKSVSHVGIYLGNNKFLHAPRKGLRVTTTELTGYWKDRLVGFGRIPGACKLPV